MKRDPPHAETVRRAALPEVMLPEDVALALQIDCEAAEEAMLGGECGPVLVLGDRPAVLRVSFLEALKAREFDPRGGGSLQ
jgi:hypothetical protein